MTKSPPLKALASAGQAIWLDYLHPELTHSGKLARLIAEDHLTGQTSNPSIFEKAIGDGQVYDRRIGDLVAEGLTDPGEIYERLAVADIQAAADVFRPTFDRLRGRDGYVSLEVSPRLAHDTAGSIAEARRLWKAVDRPNLMIKIPGTREGAPAIQALIAEGINVNVTLLFGIDAYLAVAEAHTAGLEAHKAGGGNVGAVHGVASFFVSRIDTAIDKQIDEKLKDADPATAERLKAVRGKVAIANAKMAYQHYLQLASTERWRALEHAGAAPQRLLWASTSTKDPAYPELLYAEALIGPETVDTLPMKTLEAFREHGQVAQTLVDDIAGARRVLSEAEALGLDLDAVTDRLVDEGVEAFEKSFATLLQAVADKQAQIGKDQPRRASA
ncbi:MAG: transaldolase [Proteobacteria bacterium]|nr:transaldolase [Pseudomonadota bacterium]